MQRDDADVERRHRVRSPDEVALDLTVAGPTSRIAAYAVDTILMLVVVVALVVVAFVAGTVGWGTLRTWFARFARWVALLVGALPQPDARNRSCSSGVET